MSHLRRWRIVVAAASASLLAGVLLATPAGADPDPTLTDAYDAVGTTHIGSINADVPIAFTTLTETLDVNTLQIVDGSLPIAPQQVSFQALGFIPIRSTVSLIETSPVTGSITPTENGNVITSKVSYTIKLSDVAVNVLGVWVPLFVGNNCRTINPVTISASSPPGQYFDILDGGTVTGKFTIGNFRDCAPLQLPDIFGIGSLPINALVPGTNNTATIQLSNGRFVSSTP
jgi:hypothetical protein